ncbi:MAG: hypothetical protein KAT34_15930 [Candidatus Aminicenantes bacterium]|nr:hypothetical protein [Candidatus Aminicenantes bacterium]
MERGKVKQIFQQFLIAVVVFSLICPGSLWAKKKGSYMALTKLGGEVIEGELLRVKENSLLLKTSTNGVTIDINEVDKIWITKKSKVGKGALIGALVLGIPAFALGLLLGFIGAGLEESGAMADGILIGCAGTGAGLLFGTFAGGVASRGYKTYQLKGKSPDEIKYILWKLRKRARFKD